jgi:cell wall-associated NlpC family hydrolase
MAKSVGVSGSAVALSAGGALLVYAGLRGQQPLEALRGVLTGRVEPVPAGKPVDVPGAQDGAGASRTSIAVPGAVGRAVDIALQQVGKPYRWGGVGPNSFDCSGLISYAYNHAGIRIGRLTSLGFAVSPKFRKISRNDVQAGDVLYKPGHVALAISNSQLVEAPRTGIPVRTREISGFTMYLRYAGAASTTPAPSVRNPRGRPMR